MPVLLRLTRMPCTGVQVTSVKQNETTLVPAVTMGASQTSKFLPSML